ncbi:hypothetical protein ACRAWG_31600 [Methylobacterium sp. P31]
MNGFDERLACAFVHGLVQLAIERGVDPVDRLQQFRSLQQAAIVMSRDPPVAQTVEQLVRAIDLTLQELAAVQS